MENGYDQSKLSLNKYIASKEKWTETELEERSEILAKVPLDEDIDYKEMKIVKFKFEDKEYSVKTWTEMYQSVIILLHKKNPSILNIIINNDLDLASELHISNKEETYARCAKISEGIYAGTNKNTLYKLTHLLKLFKLFEVDTSV